MLRNMYHNIFHAALIMFSNKLLKNNNLCNSRIINVNVLNSNMYLKKQTNKSLVKYQTLKKIPFGFIYEVLKLERYLG